MNAISMNDIWNYKRRRNNMWETIAIIFGIGLLASVIRNAFYWDEVKGLKKEIKKLRDIME